MSAPDFDLPASGETAPRDARFPHAPAGWSAEAAAELAAGEGLELGADHYEALAALQEYSHRRGERRFNVRECTDALQERFHARGGLKYLYRLFPAGPVAQGCRLAGLQPPTGSVDPGFGSVQ